MNYSHITIVHVSEPKERLEKLEIKRDRVTISTVDNVNMYPSIEIATTREVLRFFSRGLNSATKNTINLYLEVVCFWANSTFISFDRDYY